MMEVMVTIGAVYKTVKAAVKSSPPTNQQAGCYGLDVLPDAQPIVPEHWMQSEVDAWPAETLQLQCLCFFFQRDYIINIINCRNPLWMQDKFVGVKCRLQERDYCQLTCFVDIFCNWLCTSFICILVTLLLSRISEHSTFARYFVSRFSGIY